MVRRDLTRPRFLPWTINRSIIRTCRTSLHARRVWRRAWPLFQPILRAMVREEWLRWGRMLSWKGDVVAVRVALSRCNIASLTHACGDRCFACRFFSSPLLFDGWKLYCQRIRKGVLVPLRAGRRGKMCSSERGWGGAEGGAEAFLSVGASSAAAGSVCKRFFVLQRTRDRPLLITERHLVYKQYEYSLHLHDHVF